MRPPEDAAFCLRNDLDLVHTADLNAQIVFFAENDFFLHRCSHSHLNATAISLMCEPYTALKLTLMRSKMRDIRRSALCL